MRTSELRARLTESAENFKFDEGQAEVFARTGQLAVSQVLPTSSFESIAAACRRLFRRPLPLTRQIDDPDWQQVEKVTLFRQPNGLKERSHTMAMLAPELVTVAEWTDSVVRQLGGDLLQLGYDEAGEALWGHESNRSIVNRMCGEPSAPAVIGVHTDPSEEKGANAVLTLDPGVDSVTGEVVPPNTLNIYACLDVSEALGIAQPEHGFRSDVTRLSVVFTDFQG